MTNIPANKSSEKMNTRKKKIKKIINPQAKKNTRLEKI